MTYRSLHPSRDKYSRTGFLLPCRAAFTDIHLVLTRSGLESEVWGKNPGSVVLAGMKSTNPISFPTRRQTLAPLIHE